MNTSLQHAKWTVNIRLEANGKIVQVLKPLKRKEGEPKIKKGSKNWKHQQLHAILTRAIHSDYYTDYFKGAYNRIPREFLSLVNSKFRETVQFQVQNIAEDGTVLNESEWVGMDDLARKMALNDEPFTIRNLVAPEKAPSAVEPVEEFDFGFMGDVGASKAKTSKA
jgi:hypothetical protein